MATLTRVSGQGLGDAHSMRCPSLSRDQQLPSCAEMPLLQSMPSSEVWPELREKEQRKATGDSFLKEKYIRASKGIVELWNDPGTIPGWAGPFKVTPSNPTAMRDIFD
ncbi:hypothetical protein TURU_098326 [Turdus rufiventris]|nr:hypothetical protein TURU_098326 [Turdus rufiventris]